jgi:cytochrome P450
MVEVQNWSMNHSKDNWVDPWVFNPERFLSDAKAASELGNKLDALQAFSVGPRNCVGRKYVNLSNLLFRNLLLTRVILQPGLC